MSAGQHKGQRMDVKEFEQQMQPKAKRSRLEPFHAQIFELKEKGYANWQICKYLADNGINISQEGLRKFIKSRDGQPVPKTAGTGSTKASGLHNPTTTGEVAPAPQGEATPVVEKQELVEVLDAKKQEQKTSQYIKSSNPLANRNKK